MKTLKYLIGIIILIFQISVGFAQNSSIQDLLNNFQSKEGEAVEVSGLVTQFIESNTKTTSYFLIKDDFGGQIKVHTLDKIISTNEKYTIKGILNYDARNKEPYITEISRVLFGKIIVFDKDDNKVKKDGKNISITIFLGILTMILTILFIILLNKKLTATHQPVQSLAREPKKFAESTSNELININQQENFSTIKIPNAAPKTMKLFPGELEIINGPDKGKKFKMVGNQTSIGNIVTIGRESVSGDSSFSHIELKEKTVSRKQAELIANNGNLWIKNLSETNYTRADGKDLKPGEQAELKDNSTITVGELELKYNA